MRNALIILAATLVLSAACLAAAADARQGEVLARSGCRCHRPGELEDFDQEEMLDKLLAYKSGESEHRVMSRQADRYTKEELADIAAYYASK